MPFQKTSPNLAYRNNYPHADPGILDLIRWRVTRKAPPKPKPFPLTPNDPAALLTNRTRPSLTWVGHSTFLVQIEGKNFLTDPIFSDRASPFPIAGPKRITPVGIAMEALPHIDFVLVSHNHYDHLDKATLKRLWARDRPLIVTSLGNDAILRSHGMAAANRRRHQQPRAARRQGGHHGAACVQARAGEQHAATADAVAVVAPEQLGHGKAQQHAQQGALGLNNAEPKALRDELQRGQVEVGAQRLETQQQPHEGNDEPC